MCPPSASASAAASPSPSPPRARRPSRAAATRATAATAALLRKLDQPTEPEETDREEEREEEEDADGSGGESDFQFDSDAAESAEESESSASGSDANCLPAPTRPLTRSNSAGQATRVNTRATLRRGRSAGSEGAAAASSHSTAASSTSSVASPSLLRLTSSSAPRDSTGRLVCQHPFCGKTFLKVGKLNRHHRSAHGQERPFLCTFPGCHKAFTRNDRLRRHWKIHQAQEMEMGKVGAAAVGLAREQRGEGAVTGELDEEMVRASWEEELQLMSESDVEPIVPTAILRKANAAAEAASSSSYASTDLLVTAPPALTAPTLPPLVKFSCSYAGCTHSFLLREHLKRHERVVHDSESTASPTAAVAASVPSSVASTPSRASSSRRPASEKKSYPCTHLGCFLIFDKAHKLREHAYVHSGVMPWICNQPIEMDAGRDEDGEEEEEEEKQKGKAASSSSSTRPLEYCREGFLTKALLTKHQHLCHDPKRHICGEEGCGQRFLRFNDLRKHRAAEHKKRLTCDKCAATFPRKHDLNEHQLTHLPKEERERHLLPCPFTHPPHRCRKKFTTQSNLNQHIRRLHDATWRGKGPVGGYKITGTTGEEANDDKTDAAEEGERKEEEAGPAVLRYPCPFPSCALRMQLQPYRLKQSLQRHLTSYHSIPADALNDGEYIRQAVLAEINNPLPAPPKLHPNAAKRKSGRVALIGAEKPFRKTGGKRKREGEQEEEEEGKEEEQEEEKDKEEADEQPMVDGPSAPDSDQQQPDSSASNQAQPQQQTDNNIQLQQQPQPIPAEEADSISPASSTASQPTAPSPSPPPHAAAKRMRIDSFFAPLPRSAPAPSPASADAPPASPLISPSKA